MRVQLSTIATILSIAAMSVSAQSQEIPRSGTFQGRWEVVGKAMKIDLGTSRSVSVARFEGAVVLEGSAQGLARGFRANCVGLQDQSTGGLGRCVWKDRFDDEIWSEIESRSTGSSRSSQAKFVGGTGKFEGIEGEFSFEWIYMIPASEEGPVRGYSTRVSGRWELP